MSFFVAVVGLGLLILVHELGHFVASIALKMRPRKFYLGFPPAIVKTTRGGIEYGIGAIPLGGFVKIPGMHRPAPGDVDGRLARAAVEAPDLAGPIERLRWALGAGDHVSARAATGTLRVLTAERELSEHTHAAATRALDDIEDALGPDAYWRAATWKRVIVIAAGPAANIVLAIVLLIALFASSGGKATTRVAEVSPNSPAAHAGLRAGDEVIEVAGVSRDREGHPEPDRRLEGPADRARRAAEREPRAARARPAAVDGRRLPARFRAARCRVAAAAGDHRCVSRHGRGHARHRVDDRASRQREGTRPDLEPRGHRPGVVPGGQAGRGVVSLGAGADLLSIALLNLLPLLPLDGGHIAFAVVEGIRGRALTREVYERVSVVGIALVLLLFVIGLSNDIPNIS